MKFFTEFVDDDNGMVVDKLNEYIEEVQRTTKGKTKVNVIGYQVVRYEQLNKERTYILVEGFTE